MAESLGINMCEGYGLSETSPLIAVGNWDPTRRKPGTVSGDYVMVPLRTVVLPLPHHYYHHYRY